MPKTKSFALLALMLAAQLPEALPAFGADESPTPPKKSLYERLGGKPKIKGAVTQFVETISSDARLMKNPELKQLTKSLDRQKLVTDLTERVCAVSGGPCKPTKTPLDKLAPNVKVSALEWGYLLQDLNQTLQKAGIPRQEQGELLTLMMRAKTRAEAKPKAKPGT